MTQPCDLTRVMQQHCSPQQAAWEPQQPGAALPSLRCWVAGLAELQADDCERWQAGERVVEDRWLKGRLNVM